MGVKTLTIFYFSTSYIMMSDLDTDTQLAVVSFC